MNLKCTVQRSVLQDVQHLLDLSEAEGGAKEVALLNVSPPQPLAKLIQLLHTQ